MESKEKHHIFLWPIDRWTHQGGTASRNMYEGICFATREAAEDFCRDYTTPGRKLIPVELYFSAETLH